MSSFKIIEYEDKYKESFKDLNVEWLSDMFVVEPYDLEVLSDPQKYILSGGGSIWLVQAVGGNSDGEIVGTCALMEHEADSYELTKMAVSGKTRGHGVGRDLLKYVIGMAKERNAKALFLLTNTKCEAAIHLYKQEGFVENAEIRSKYGSSYERCNLGMLYIGS